MASSPSEGETLEKPRAVLPHLWLPINGEAWGLETLGHSGRPKQEGSHWGPSTGPLTEGKPRNNNRGW